MKLSLPVNFPTKASLQSWPAKNYFILGGVLLLLLLAAGGIYAAFLPPTSTIKVQTYEVVNGTPQRLGNVTVQLDSYKSSAECADSTKTTEPASTGANHGIVNFYGCPTGIRYTIANMSRSGYVQAANSPIKTKTSRFYSRKNRVTTINLYLVKAGDAAPIRISGPSKKNNIYNTASRDHFYNKVNPDGAWIMNFTDTYYIGMVYDGWSIDVAKKSEAGWYFGLVSRPDGTVIGCAWIEPEIVRPGTDTPSANSCSGQDATLKDRDRVGMDFNCAFNTDGSCNRPASAVEVGPNCDTTLYKNYFTNNNYESGSFADPVGKIESFPTNFDPPQRAGYRFTTHDEKAAVVFSSTYGWGFIDRTCIPGTPRGTN
ncbi:MAG TPA: hypothetical protein VF272_02880 [Candidatus Saccharimonadia bacterium]